LHEETKRLGAERSAALEAEREATRRLGALYEISRSFSESLSLQATLEGVARTIVDTLQLDAAAVRMPNERGDALEPVAVHVREDRLGEPVRQILSLALALDNARLHQERKAFTDTMRLSLMPRRRPQVAQLEIGDHYEPSTRVEIGGDVYDYLELADGRLAVVLGDVTGHGIDAAADMA